MATDPKNLRVTKQLAELCEHGEYREHPVVRSEKAHLDNQPTNWVDAAQMASQGITIETCPGGRLDAVGRVVWMCGGNGEWLEYTEEEWIEVFGEVPTDRCLLCGRTLEHMSCGFYNVSLIRSQPFPPAGGVS